MQKFSAIRSTAAAAFVHSRSHLNTAYAVDVPTFINI